VSRRLVEMLVRLPPEVAAALDETVARTRIRKADLLRQAVADLVQRYRSHPAPPATSPPLPEARP
jgi:hypothetical protein